MAGLEQTDVVTFKDVSVGNETKANINGSTNLKWVQFSS